MDILENFTETELTYLFDGSGVTEGQYSFASQGKKIANPVIDPATGAATEYIHLTKDDLHRKKSGSNNLQMIWEGSRERKTFYLPIITAFKGNTANTLHMSALW